MNGVVENGGSLRAGASLPLQDDVNGMLHAYWLAEQEGDFREDPDDSEYWLEVSYRKWCEASEENCPEINLPAPSRSPCLSEDLP